VVSTIVYTSNSLAVPPLIVPPGDVFKVTITDGHGGTQVVTLNPFAQS
jgi:hypothetical protein